MSIQKTSNQKRMAKSLPVTQTHKEYNDVIDIIAFDSIQGAIYTAKKDPISKNTETQKRYVSQQQIVRISSISKKKKKKMETTQTQCSNGSIFVLANFRSYPTKKKETHI
jgi:hypothetical protein